MTFFHIYIILFLHYHFYNLKLKIGCLITAFFAVYGKKLLYLFRPKENNLINIYNGLRTD